LSRTLVIVHAGIAAATKCPEMEIDAEEGKILANASANVMAQFDLAPDPKTQAIIGLIMACGTVYGPRAFMIRMRQAQERSEGAGTAGVYAADGSAAGTTTYTPAASGPPN
jgi:hypothetical protein